MMKFKKWLEGFSPFQVKNTPPGSNPLDFVASGIDDDQEMNPVVRQKSKETFAFPVLSKKKKSRK